MMFIDEVYKSDPPGPDGLPSGRFRLAGRDRELVIIIGRSWVVFFVKNMLTTIVVVFGSRSSHQLITQERGDRCQ